ncbi:MAG: serine/threonine-protein kinase [Lachnotalea sp.]
MLFEKYLIEQPIGCGLSGNVYLAEHMKLKAKRVIKCVSKKQLMYQQFLKEATLLKNLKHPNIPIIYDLEEDEEYLYIIEEYIKGESLRAVMLNQIAISRENIIDFTIQICNIIEYLHSMKPFPILYLDLKPDHIIVCNNCVKIIDFGSAIYMEKEETDYSFGTPCFAAPEQFESLKLDSKTDIYAIGSVLFFMLIGRNPSLSYSTKSLKNEMKNVSTDLKKIILNCMAENPKDRYNSVSQLKIELLVCLKNKKSLIIAVLGSQSRIGVTHIAIGLVSFLNKYGMKAIYEEKNNNCMISNLYQENEIVAETSGIYSIKDFEAIPDYNKTICIDKDSYDVIVLDCGSYTEMRNEFRTADMRIVVLGTKEWELQYARECISTLKDIEKQYILNMCDKNQAYQAAKFLGIMRGYRMPLFSNPFENSSIAEKVYKDITKGKLVKVKRRLKLRN